MKRILSQRHIDVLAQFAWSRVLLAFDFDGTLAPIVPDRERATMRDSTKELFERVARLYPCAVISGRGRDDVARRTNGVPVRHILGNHGLEPGEHLAEFEALMKRIRPQLEEQLSALNGIDVEDKRYSLAIHYRRSRAKREARKLIHATIAGLSLPLRTIPGKLVVNVVPEAAAHKGDAVVALRESEGVDTIVYVGDDATDEDVFELDLPGRLLSIRVGLSQRSSAPYYIRNQREIDLLLRQLARLRERNGKS
jgi:trehalose 6-phosphate phosphatase